MGFGDSRHTQPLCSVAPLASKRGTLPTPILLIGLVALAFGPASAQVSRPPATVNEAEPTDAASAPTMEWLKDEEGREYVVRKLPKGREHVDYTWTSDNVIRIQGGLPLVIDREDEDFFYYRSFRKKNAKPEAATPPVVAADPPPAPAAQEARVRGHFRPFDDGLPTSGQWRQGFELADMNQDGHLDLVHGPPRKGPPLPFIWLGDSHGKWQAWEAASFPELPFDYGDIAVADFNADGHLDLALAMHLTGFLVLTGDSKGGFESWSEGLNPESERSQPWTSRALTASDFNGDDRMDLAALGEGRQSAGQGQTTPQDARGLAVFLNQGDGTWQRTHNPAYLFGDDLVSADLNGDLAPDFVSASHTLRGRHILWQGATDEQTWTATELQALPKRSIVEAVQTTDFDLDGDTDLLLGGMRIIGKDWHSEIAAYRLEKAGEYQRQELISSKGTDHVYSIAVGDLDGDGRIDLAAGTGKAELWLLRGVGGGSFARVQHALTSTTDNCRIYAIEMRDIDGDGKDELFATFSGEGIELPLVGGLEGCDGDGGIYAWSLERFEEIEGDSAVEAAGF